MRRSRRSSTFSLAASKKLGQPVPESNLVPASNSAAPQAAQRYFLGVGPHRYAAERRLGAAAPEDVELLGRQLL